MLYIGIDWSKDKHDVCICNQEGARISQLVIPDTLRGYQRLESQREKLDVPAAECIVGIEIEGNLIVDYLQDRGYTLYIIPPIATKAYRKVDRSSNARDDRSDAALLAWIVRFDRRERYRLQPNSDLTQQILVQVRLIHQVKTAVQRFRSQLDSALLRAYPAALEAFGDLGRLYVLRFLEAYPTQEEAQRLSLDEFVAACRECGYRRKDLLPGRYDRLKRTSSAPPRQVGLRHRNQVRVLAHHLLPLIKTKKQIQRELTKLFVQHPDAPIFDSLPGAGELLAPSLLAKFGDHRERFTKPGNVQALAGTCPITIASGKQHADVFRKHCDREFRRIIQQFAHCSLKESAWANAYWHEVEPRCDSSSHATRIVANRWLVVIWTIWTRRELYDESYHMQQRLLHRVAKVA